MVAYFLCLVFLLVIQGTILYKSPRDYTWKSYLLSKGGIIIIFCDIIFIAVNFYLTLAVSLFYLFFHFSITDDDVQTPVVISLFDREIRTIKNIISEIIESF